MWLYWIQKDHQPSGVNFTNFFQQFFCQKLSLWVKKNCAKSALEILVKLIPGVRNAEWNVKYILVLMFEPPKKLIGYLVLSIQQNLTLPGALVPQICTKSSWDWNFRQHTKFICFMLCHFIVIQIISITLQGRNSQNLLCKFVRFCVNLALNLEIN